MLKAIKKRYNCNGNIKKDKEYGEIMQVCSPPPRCLPLLGISSPFFPQVQGDQRANIKEFLMIEQIYDSESRIVIHGF